MSVARVWFLGLPRKGLGYPPPPICGLDVENAVRNCGQVTSAGAMGFKIPHPPPPVLGVLWKTGYETDRRDGAGGQRSNGKDQETAGPGSGEAGEVLRGSAHDGSLSPLLIVSDVSIGLRKEGCGKRAAERGLWKALWLDLSVTAGTRPESGSAVSSAR